MLRFSLPVLLALTLEPAGLVAQKTKPAGPWNDMQDKLRLAKTLQGTLELSLETADQKLELTGPLHLAAGNKVRLELKGLRNDKAAALTFLSDGKTLRLRGLDDQEKEEPAPGDLQERFLYLLGRTGMGAGLLISREMKKVEKNQPWDKWYYVSLFKSLGERVEEKRMRIGVQHNLRIGGLTSYRVECWLDKEDKLPAARFVQPSLKTTKDKLLIVEKYQLKLDQPIEEKVFMLELK